MQEELFGPESLGMGINLRAFTTLRQSNLNSSLDQTHYIGPISLDENSTSGWYNRRYR